MKVYHAAMFVWFLWLTMCQRVGSFSFWICAFFLTFYGLVLICDVWELFDERR